MHLQVRGAPQTKTKLGNSKVRGAVDSFVYEGLLSWFEDAPDLLRPIVDKAVRARQAREAAKKARELVRFRSLDFFDGSLIIPVAPPIRTIGLCPQSWKANMGEKEPSVVVKRES